MGWSITGIDSGRINKGQTDYVPFDHVGYLIGNSQADKFNFSAGATITGTVDGGGGDDLINLAAYPATSPITWAIAGPNAGTASSKVGLIVYTQVEDLTGGQGNDVFRMAMGGSARIVNGGAGSGDTLDYLAYTTSVVINLQAGSATALTGSVSGIEYVFGGAGGDTLIGKDGHNNLLVGNGGGDTLTGGNGRDILIGGAGADTLYGYGGDDILIGARTDYDVPSFSSLAALDAIMAEWGSARTYKQRLHNLSNGTADSANNLDGLTFNSRQRRLPNLNAARPGASSAGLV